MPVKLDASLAKDPSHPGLTNQELFELYRQLMQDTQRVIEIATNGQMRRYRKLKMVGFFIRTALVSVCGSFLFEAISVFV